MLLKNQNDEAHFRVRDYLIDLYSANHMDDMVQIKMGLPLFLTLQQ